MHKVALPRGWREVRLGDVCSPRQWPTIGSKQMTADGVPVFGANGFIGHYSEANHEADVVAITCRGATCGSINYIRGPVYVTGNAMCLDHVDDRKISPRYLYHLLSNSDLRPTITGGAQPQIIKSAVEEFEVVVPPREDQDELLDILDTWEEAITKTDALVCAKRQQFGWIRSAVLTGRPRLQGFNAPWQTVELASVLHEHGARSTGAESVYSVSVHRGLVDQVEHLGRSFAAADTGHYNRVKPGDIVYTKSPTGDFPLGIIKQSKIDREVLVSPLYGVFTPQTRALGVILDAYFSSPQSAARYLAPLVQKGAKNTINVTNQQFLQGTVMLPTDEHEVAALAKLVQCSLAEIDLLKSKADAFRCQKRGLMQKLLTGTWRIEVREIEAAE